MTSRLRGPVQSKQDRTWPARTDTLAPSTTDDASGISEQPLQDGRGGPDLRQPARPGHHPLAGPLGGEPGQGVGTVSGIGPRVWVKYGPRRSYHRNRSR